MLFLVTSLLSSKAFETQKCQFRLTYAKARRSLQNRLKKVAFNESICHSEQKQANAFIYSMVFLDEMSIMSTPVNYPVEKELN